MSLEPPSQHHCHPTDGMCCWRCLSGGGRGGNGNGNGDDSSGGDGNPRGCTAKWVRVGAQAEGVDALATALLVS